jgi:hypothetical protein
MMRLTTGQKLQEVLISVELDESGDVALLANGTPILWVLHDLHGVRFNTCDEHTLNVLGFRMNDKKVAIV